MKNSNFVYVCYGKIVLLLMLKLVSDNSKLTTYVKYKIIFNNKLDDVCYGKKLDILILHPHTR